MATEVEIIPALPETEGPVSAPIEEDVIEEKMEAPVQVVAATEEPSRNQRSSWDVWGAFPTYGNYGGPNYSSGMQGGNPLAADAPKPTDELDAVYQRHDVDFTKAKSNNDILRADKEMLAGIVKLITDPAWSASHPEGLAYGVATIPAFVAKIVACELGACGLSTVSFPEGEKEEKKVKATPAKIKSMVTKALGGVIQPISEARASRSQDWDVLGPKTRRRRKRAEVSQIADMVQQLLMRSGDVETNPGPYTWQGYHQSRLMLAGDVERNPGPDPGAEEGLTQIEKAVDYALKILSSTKGYFRNPDDIEAAFKSSSDMAFPVTGSAVPVAHMDAYPVIGCSAEQQRAIHNLTPNTTTAEVAILHNRCEITGAPVRKMRINPALQSIYSAVTGMANDPASIQQFFATIRTNFFRFNGQDLAEFFGSSLPLPRADGSLEAGSAASQLAILMAWMSVNTHIDPYSLIAEAWNQYHTPAGGVGTAWGSLKAPAYSAGTTTAAGAGIFPLSKGYTTNSDFIVGQAVSFGTFLKMANANAYNTSSFARQYWSDINFVIVPCVTGMPLSDGGYMTMLTLSRCHHPFTVPVDARPRVDSKSKPYSNFTADNVTNSAFHSAIDGPRIIDYSSSGRDVNLYVLYVICDVGSENGSTQNITLTIGNTTTVQLDTNTVPAAGKAIGPAIYDVLQVGGNYVEQSAASVFRDMMRSYASEDCLQAAVSWLIGVTPVVKAPCYRLGGGLNGPTSLYMVEANVDTPAFPYTDMSRCDDLANKDAYFATNPIGQLWTIGNTTNINGEYILGNDNIYARLPKPSVFSDMALMMNWMWLVAPGSSNNLSGVGEMCGSKVREMQIWGGAYVAAGFDRLAEMTGSPDLWYEARQDSTSGYYNVPMLKGIAAAGGDALGLAIEYPRLGQDSMNFSTLGLTAPRRISVVFAEENLIPDNALVPLPRPSEATEVISIAGNPAYLRLDEMTGSTGKGRGWSKSYDVRLRSIAFTGDAGQGTNAQTLLKLCYRDGTATFSTVTSAYPQLLIDSAWYAVFNELRRVSVDVDAPCGNAQPWMDPYAGSTNGRFRQLYFYVSTTYAAYFGGNGFQPAAWKIPQLPKDRPLHATSLLGLGSAVPWTDVSEMFGAAKLQTEAEMPGSSFQGNDEPAGQE
jgi:hypothetical protein